MSATLTQAIRFIITGDSKGAQKAFQELDKTVDGTQKATAGWGSRMNTAANYGAVGVAALTGVIVKSTRDYMAHGAAIRDVARLTDISTEAASRLTGQWERYGIDATAGATGIKFLMRNIDEARQGSERQVEAFERMGISMADLQSLSDEEILFKTRDALADMGPSAERTNIALTLLGRGGTAMLPWLSASSSEMADLNDQLERAGLVWGDDEMQQYKDAVKAQREMQIALKGIEETIARDVVPALTPFVRLLGEVLRALQPLAPVIVPLTGALATFVGVVKVASAVSRAWKDTIGKLIEKLVLQKGAAEGATTATELNTTATGLNTGALGASLGTLAAYAGALAAIAAEIYLIVDAYMKWRDAAQQAEQAYSGAMGNLESAYAAGKLTPQQYQTMKAQIEADRYKAPSGVWGWLREAFKAQFGEHGWTRGFGLATGGTVKASRGGTVIVAGEGGEDEDIVPASKRGVYARRMLGAGITINLSWSSLARPSRREIREVAYLLGQELGGLA